MPIVDEREWIAQRIEATRAMIVAYEAAILALSSGALSYTLDTGQTRQSVTKQQLGSLRIQLDALEHRLADYMNRLNGGATVIVRPGY
jgi:hypothetical protein